jgi:outer membrane protein OmpA-like peptidoglycan-associated protein
MVMKGVFVWRISLLLALSAVPFKMAYADDAAKLKELEKAMSAPPPPAEQPVKRRTRAIVFDSEPGQGGQAAEAAKAEPKAEAAMDCQALPQNVRTTAVDFNIQFKSGSAELAPDSIATVQQIAKILALSPTRCVLVEGHTDSYGSVERNMELSRERAESVVRYVTETSALDPKRLVPVGKGPTEPIRNLDPRNARNRRVVFKVVG